jgi:lipopolysaccharide transport system ATP-binding protein
MPQPVITIENLAKRYTVGHRRCKDDGLRHAIESAVRAPLAWIRSRQERKLQLAEFWALKDVSFQVNQGEVVGIIGRNGAGKTTLLKLLSRITVPTKGRIRIDGRIASLLEVGTGFHPDLTGRENIFLNGAILGMTRAEIAQKFDQIVEFSEIEDFLDTPVKRYSSGMYIRLAFAVAAHLEPEILIVDEVLAVGDAAFQAKCLGKMGEVAHGGRTVLFVSHNMDAVRGLCQRGIWLKEGQVYQDGNVEQVSAAYFESISNDSTISLANPEYGLRILKVALTNERGQEVRQFEPGDDLTVVISYAADKRIPRPIIALGVIGVNGSCFTANMHLDGNRPNSLDGAGKISCTFRSIPLLPQSYTVRLRVQGADPSELIIPYQDVAAFNVVGDLAEYGFKGEVLLARRATAVVIPYEWQLPDGTAASVTLARKGAPIY